MEGRGGWVIPPPREEGPSRPPSVPPSEPEARPPRRRRAWIWAAVIGGVLLFLGLILGGAFLAFYTVTKEAPAIGRVVGLIDISGVIMAERGGGLFGGFAGAKSIVKQIGHAMEEDNIRAVVLRINSPGGTAAGAQEIHQAVRRLRKKKPVVASLGDVATSGAYYTASAADVIVASPGTMTGSIGVIMELADLSGLMSKLGIRMVTIKSGKFKDIGSISRPPTPEEKALLESLVMDVYDQFVKDVAKARGMPVEKVKTMADGRILTGRMAKSYGLVDELGSFEDAVRIAARRAGIKGKPRVVRLAPKTSLLELLLSPEEWGYSTRAFLSYLCTPVKLLPPPFAR